MSTVVMQRVYSDGRSDTQIDEMNGKIGPCLEINGVKHLSTMVSKDRTRFICSFEAPDAQTVKRAIESSGVAFERIYAVDVFTSG